MVPLAQIEKKERKKKDVKVGAEEASRVSEYKRKEEPERIRS